MLKQKTLDFCLSQLFADASEAFNESPEHKLLLEKLARMNRDCDCMLMADQKDFVVECFALLRDVSSRRERFLYRSGIHDGVSLLKRLHN